MLNLQTLPPQKEEVTIKKGMTAPQTGVIHSDFEKDFIKAEVIKYNDYIEFGSENSVKEQVVNDSGKDYLPNDGILCILDLMFKKINSHIFSLLIL